MPTLDDIHFPLHPMFRNEPLKKDTEEEEDEGEGKGGNGKPALNYEPVIIFGDWKFDHQTLFLENIKQNTKFSLSRLNSHAKITRLIIAIAQKPDWDTFHFMKVLNQISKNKFNLPLDQLIQKSQLNDGYNIDWVGSRIYTKQNSIKL